MPREALLPPQREDTLLATHASDHNCVTYKRPAYSILKPRGEVMSERRARDLKNMKKGKVSEEFVTRGLEHGAAFLCPVPFTEWQPAADCLSQTNSWKNSPVLRQQLRQPEGRARRSFHTPAAATGVAFGAFVSGRTAPALFIPGDTVVYRDQLRTWIVFRLTVLAEEELAQEGMPSEVNV